MSTLMRPDPTIQRSSLFDLAAHSKHLPYGKSNLSFAIEPHPDDEPPRQRQIEYENTYQMDPVVRFQADKVTPIIKEILDTNLTDKTYDPIVCSQLAKSMTADIKTRVKNLDFKRYKIVVQVSVGERKDQDVRFGGRCVWDADRDTFASAWFQNPHLYAVGEVYAVYYE